jgi:hypothetical protein
LFRVCRLTTGRFRQGRKETHDAPNDSQNDNK